MTLIDAIKEFDLYRKNESPLEQKIKWISELDRKINGEYLIVRGGEQFEGYDLQTPYHTTLKAPDEYSELYSLYLNMKLDYVNGEVTRFNNSAALFNRLYKEMGDFINRQKKVSVNTKIKAGDLYV